MTANGSPLIAVEGVTHAFGGILAVNDCTWSMGGGVIAALIGPNGAGKTTLANLIAGALPLQHGRIAFDGHDISGAAPHTVAQQGIIRTFQISRDFEKLTLLENLLVAAPDQPGESLFAAFFQPGKTKAAEKRNLERAAHLLDQFGLYQWRNDYASDISGGQKRLLELARAVMAEPRLMLLDEPMAGINPALIERICIHLKEIQKTGVTLLMIEHNLSVVESICEWVTVMVEGKVLTSGTMSELRQHPAVVDAYLGREVSGLA
jgi:ABC-type branched-subunit amino acid transport system ATPase component